MKQRTVWVGRDASGGKRCNFYLRSERPTSDERGLFWVFDFDMDNGMFRDITGFVLKPGEVCKVKISVRRVK